jgi:hypothetical protein
MPRLREKPSEQDGTKPLINARHEMVAQMVAAGGSAKSIMKRCALKQGRSNPYSGLTGIKARPEVRARIQHLQGAIAARLVERTAQSEAVTREEVIAECRQVIELSKIPDSYGRYDHNARVKAAELMGKSIAMFSERRIVQDEATEFEGLSAEEAQQKLVGLVGQLDPNQVRALLGSLGAGASGQVPDVDSDESTESVQAVSETGGVPSTRH